ncbi:NAD(P)-binding domain-containing protein [Bradyrhizobium genosp. P]|uniref:NAD(P)-binding domain-containing protein n=1 Tax=Bradyrhizobium genosp. P TaxID=83641 RepID=UPI003CE8390B
MTDSDHIDVAIVGGGPGGVIALYYATQAGLKTILLEKQDTVGGLWAQLPAWQDIQNRAEDWTLGDLPIAGVDQSSILANIQQWVHQFDLGQHIRLGTTALYATPTQEGWTIKTSAGELRAKALISATGVHNRPIIPDVERSRSDVVEVHSSMLRDPTSLSGKRVIVAGGGASAFDLVDLSLEHGASQVVWVYHSLRWMVPTRKPKRFASNLRELAKRHMLGESAAQIGSVIDAELRARYQKFGMEELLPDAPFDTEKDQLIPGRWRLIENLGRIERHRDDIRKIEGRSVVLRSGTTIAADVILWGTGYEMDLSYLQAVGLNQITRPDQLARRCGSMVVGLDAPNLYFVSVGLESTSATPWQYAHLARTIVSQICGTAKLNKEPVLRHLNYFGVPTFLAEFDPASYPSDTWRNEYVSLVTDFPNERPFPIPVMPTG